MEYKVTTIENESNSNKIYNNKSKDVNSDELGSQDELQISHDKRFYGIMPSC